MRMGRRTAQCHVKGLVGDSEKGLWDYAEGCGNEGPSLSWTKSTEENRKGEIVVGSFNRTKCWRWGNQKSHWLKCWMDHPPDQWGYWENNRIRDGKIHCEPGSEVFSRSKGVIRTLLDKRTGHRKCKFSAWAAKGQIFCQKPQEKFRNHNREEGQQPAPPETCGAWRQRTPGRAAGHGRTSGDSHICGGKAIKRKIKWKDGDAARWGLGRKGGWVGNWEWLE